MREARAVIWVAEGEGAAAVGEGGKMEVVVGKIMVGRGSSDMGPGRFLSESEHARVLPSRHVMIDDAQVYSASGSFPAIILS